MPNEDKVLFFVEPNKMLIYFISVYYGKTMLLKYNRSVIYGCNLKLWKMWTLEPGNIASNLGIPD